MKCVTVNASKTYDVLIGRGLLDEAGERIRSVCDAETAVIIAGDRVWPLYGARLSRSLEKAGFRAAHIVIPHGEQHKTLETYAGILNELCRLHVTRSDVLVALGGGVTGDLTGFAAATYQRGCGFVQIPTTLLAMVDSSVGGKTAVDLPGGKNQAGAFYQPSLVLCDPDTLDTLPEAEFRAGCAEVIKYGMLGDADFFASLQETPVQQQAEAVIEQCVSMKRDIVHEDEYDTGLRRVLNLGHSFGHAIEHCSAYRILHGEAVAIGMVMITRAAVSKGICQEETLTRLLQLLRSYQLPTECTFSVHELYEAMRSDKKMTGSIMHLVVPEKIGQCRVLSVSAADLPEWLRDGGAV